jgi:CRP/FNR family cyclic AMP-dependent transcriptional regulator
MRALAAIPSRTAVSPGICSDHTVGGAFSLAPIEHHPARVVLFHQDHRPLTVTLIVSGLVTLTRAGADGRRAIVALRGPGWPLGIAATVIGRSHATSAQTVNACTVRSMPALEFARLRQSHPAIAEWALATLAQESLEHLAARGEMALSSAGQRLERVLRRLIGVLSPPRREGHFVLASPLSCRELSELVGVTREHVWRIMAALEKRGVLRRQPGHLRGIMLLPIDYWGARRDPISARL